MNTSLIIAGILCLILALVHSFLGEYYIFRNKRKKRTLVPTKKNVGLKERHLRIIWASWHITSIFGCCLGMILIKVSFAENNFDQDLIGGIVQYISYTIFSGSLLVMISSKGRHPGWFVLLVIGLMLVF